MSTRLPEPTAIVTAATVPPAPIHLTRSLVEENQAKLERAVKDWLYARRPHTSKRMIVTAPDASSISNDLSIPWLVSSCTRFTSAIECVIWF